MIEIKNLSKSFGKKLVLNNLNLTIKDNSIFGLIGINGAGKSTLLRILANVYYWNQVYLKGGYINPAYEMRVPKEWALEIIDEDEYNML